MRITIEVKSDNEKVNRLFNDVKDLPFIPLFSVPLYKMRAVSEGITEKDFDQFIKMLGIYQAVNDSLALFSERGE